MEKLVCKNQSVISFYKENPSLNFEANCITFMEILKSLSKDLNSSLNNGMATQILTNIIKLQNQMTDNFHKLQTDFKKEYIEDIKMILSNNTAEKITPLIANCNDALYNKTSVLINDLIPKNNMQLVKEVQAQITQFNTSLTEETNKLVKSTINENTLNEFIKSLDTKLNNTIVNSQTIINSNLTATEKRLDTTIKDIRTNTEKNILEIKDISTLNKTSQDLLGKNVADVLRKMENSSLKGKISENILFNILQKLFPSAQIEMVGDEKETGDIILKRKNKPTILIENKNWGKNVPQEEVKKFIRDVETKKCCGLFLSQNYGISNKENFEINMNEGNVLVYVHEVNNDADKVKIAIDIIDNFKERIDEVTLKSGLTGYNIDKDLLDDINGEYQEYIVHKLSQIKSVKDFTSKMIKQIEETQLPSLERYLSSKYAFSTGKILCDNCGFFAKNSSSLSAHKRACKAKPNNEDEP